VARTTDLRSIQDSVSVIVRVQRSRRARRRLERRAGVPLAPTAIDVLAAIDKLGPTRHGAVARSVDTQPSRISKEVRALVAAGLVVESPDPHDRRAVLLRTTDAGAAALAGYLDAAQAALADTLADWDDDDVAALAALIARLAGSFRQAPPDS
jgi:DNA-binding MarR family transcriptional regulator